MSDQFQHVMVLTSIIIGLGITNLLSGLSGAIERFTEKARPLRVGWATVFWLAYFFLLMVLFSRPRHALRQPASTRPAGIMAFPTLELGKEML